MDLLVQMDRAVRLQVLELLLQVVVQQQLVHLQQQDLLELHLLVVFREQVVLQVPQVLLEPQDQVVHLVSLADNSTI
jgi:hypothetical protein